MNPDQPSWLKGKRTWKQEAIPQGVDLVDAICRVYHCLIVLSQKFRGNFSSIQEVHKLETTQSSNNLLLPYKKVFIMELERDRCMKMVNNGRGSHALISGRVQNGKEKKRTGGSHERREKKTNFMAQDTILER